MVNGREELQILNLALITLFDLSLYEIPTRLYAAKTDPVLKPGRKGEPPDRQFNKTNTLKQGKRIGQHKYETREVTSLPRFWHNLEFRLYISVS